MPSLVDSEVIAAIPEVVAYMSLAANVALGGLGAYLLNRKRREHYKATHDELTGLRNVAGLQEVLNTNKPPRAMLYVDGTNQKGVNDKLGHDRGDAAIKLTAQTIVDSLRPEDVVARIGGDEFLVLLGVERRSNDEPPLSPYELMTTVTTRIDEKAYMLLGQEENVDLVAAGFTLAVGGVVWQEGMSIDDMRKGAETDMMAKKAVQHQLVGQHRPS